MTEPIEATPDLRTLQIRVYYDPASGEIVHVHRLVVAAGDELDDARVAEEMSAFEASLEQRHRRRLDHIAVDEETLAEAVSPDVNFAVDLENRRLVRRDQ